MNETLEMLNVKFGLDYLIDKAEEIRGECSDYLVTCANEGNVMMNQFAGLTFIPDDGGVKNLLMSPHSLSQLCGKLGVPARYIEKCIENGYINLAQDNINSWIDGYNKNLFIREYDGRIRGVLSSKYSVCDSHEILGVLKDEIDIGKYNVKGSFLNEERLHLRLVNKEMLPVDGEDLFAGLFVDSSDVGRHILTVRFGIYKQICTNGLILAKASGVLFEQRHIGIAPEEFKENLHNSLKGIDELTEKTLEHIEEARKIGNKFSLNSDEMEDIIQTIRQQTSLTEEGAEKVVVFMKEKYEDSRWGYINALTEVAQDYTLEKRLELEKIAGGLLVA